MMRLLLAGPVRSACRLRPFGISSSPLWHALSPPTAPRPRHRTAPGSRTGAPSKPKSVHVPATKRDWRSVSAPIANSTDDRSSPAPTGRIGTVRRRQANRPYLGPPRQTDITRRQVRRHRSARAARSGAGRLLANPSGSRAANKGVRESVGRPLLQRSNPRYRRHPPSSCWSAGQGEPHDPKRRAATYVTHGC